MTRITASHRAASLVVAGVALLAAAGCSSDSSSSESAASSTASTATSIDPAASTTSAPAVDESTVPPASSTPTTVAASSPSTAPASTATTAPAGPPTTAGCRRLGELETGPLGWEWPDGLVVGVGDCGPLVELIQSMLVERGYSIAVDGQFGPATAAAVRDAQPTVVLPATGSVDEETFFRIWNSNVDNVDPGA